MNRGLEGRQIFIDDTDRRVLLRILSENLVRASCLCYAWALMPNHFHLVLRPLDHPAGDCMRRINGSYARYFNKRHKRRGYLFQDRYKSLATREFTYFKELIRYVHLNPVRSGMVDNLGMLAEFEWTGHRAVLGLTETPWQASRDLLARFGNTISAARSAYLAFLADGINTEAGHGPLAAAGVNLAVKSGNDPRDERIVGDVEKVRESIMRVEREKAEHLRMMKERPSLSEIASDIATSRNLAIHALQRRGKIDGSCAIKGLFCHQARTVYGYTLGEVGAFLGITASAVAQILKRLEAKNPVNSPAETVME